MLDQASVDAWVKKELLLDASCIILYRPKQKGEMLEQDQDLERAR